ncbi:hypothetical protein VOLCADRAFT_95946 [Volvox carteri f. nagariensis]|uniref:Uncharacterized protein n=1 Tax=Volvox carteri f. nagariensis TaxID=3068 RepID=D8U8T2_VOLCA|nr:uncharacterized protein VOLCADRAFT_95946 [Volvox carteri f. nagariensis]EFJ43802.1 hypothetical protein VOLCADRAFT_95946 [Volvox carteri f. nagariensis]|eukprot:XP_002955048.1 hypothetical protein VOLCADRAFT_95946 [Volvox carteri f. nagariensis]
MSPTRRFLDPLVTYLLLLLLRVLRPVCAGPWDLSTFRLCNTLYLQEIDSNASGVTYVPESNTLWIVVNNPPGLYEYTMEGALQRKINLWWLRDPEDVVYVSRDRVAVVEEPPGGGIRVLDVSRSGGGMQTEYISLIYYPRSGGSGAEGLSYDPQSGTFYVAQEKRPKGVYAIRRTRWYTNCTKIIDGDVAFNSVGDLSAINYIPDLNEFFVLSQESSRVLRTTLEGQVLQEIGVKGSSAEGLHMMSDGLTMLVVSEPNVMRIYRADGCGNK